MAANILPGLLAVMTALCLISGIWLSLHLTALAALFRGKADFVPSPKPPRASRAVLVLALVVFCASLAGVLATQVVAIAA